MTPTADSPHRRNDKTTTVEPTVQPWQGNDPTDSS